MNNQLPLTPAPRSISSLTSDEWEKVETFLKAHTVSELQSILQLTFNKPIKRKKTLLVSVPKPMALLQQDYIDLESEKVRARSSHALGLSDWGQERIKSLSFAELRNEASIVGVPLKHKRYVERTTYLKKAELLNELLYETDYPLYFA